MTRYQVRQVALFTLAAAAFVAAIALARGRPMTETTNPEQQAQLTLAQLIERHSAAYNALSKAIDDHEDDPHHPAVDAAIDADEERSI